MSLWLCSLMSKGKLNDNNNTRVILRKYTMNLFPIWWYKILIIILLDILKHGERKREIEDPIVLYGPFNATFSSLSCPVLYSLSKRWCWCPAAGRHRPPTPTDCGGAESASRFRVIDNLMGLNIKSFVLYFIVWTAFFLCVPILEVFILFCSRFPRLMESDWGLRRWRRGRLDCCVWLADENVALNTMYCACFR